MKISKREAANFLLLVPFFKLPGFSEIKVVSMLFDFWFIVASGVILYKIVASKYKPSAVTMLIIIREIYMLVITTYKGGFSTPLIRVTVGASMLCLLIDSQLKKNKESICRAISTLFTIYSVSNLILGKGHYFQTYLFGQRTNFTIISFPMMIISIIFLLAFDDKKNHRKFKRDAVLILTINGIMILSESVSTSILCAAIIMALYLLFYYCRLDKIPAKLCIVTLAIYNFIVVIFQSFDYMRVIFEKFLGESMTMTGRLIIWGNALHDFLQQPLLGYGYSMHSISRGVYATDTMYVHNDFLQHCVEGGIIDLVLFVMIMLVSVRHLKKYSSSKLNSFMLAGFIGLEVSMISEVQSFLNYFFVFLLIVEFFSGYQHKYTEYGRQLNE